MARTTQSLIAAASMALALVAAGATQARAQRISTGTVRAEVRTSVASVVPYILRLRTSSKAEIVEQTANYTVFEMRVQAAANARWTLGVTVAEGTLDVRCETGEWIPTVADGSVVPVVFLGAPTDPTEIIVRFRVRGTPEQVKLARAQVTLRPVAVDQGAVSVSWSGSE